MYLSALNGAKTFAVVALRNGHIFQVGKGISPMTPALIHILRERVIPFKRVVVVVVVVCFLTHDDELLQDQLAF